MVEKSISDNDTNTDNIDNVTTPENSKSKSKVVTTKNKNRDYYHKKLVKHKSPKPNQKSVIQNDEEKKRKERGGKVYNGKVCPDLIHLLEIKLTSKQILAFEAQLRLKYLEAYKIPKYKILPDGRWQFPYSESDWLKTEALALITDITDTFPQSEYTDL